MADCELIANCVFFNDQMASMPSTSSLLKNNYCRGNYHNCARYMIVRKLGREKVPADLFPNDRTRAEAIISPK